MSKLTSQGVRDLNTIGKRPKRSSDPNTCPPHLLEDQIHVNYSGLVYTEKRKCLSCGKLVEEWVEFG